MEIEQDRVISNLKRCSHFESCSQSICPLDLELNLRNGKKSERCRFMREAKITKIKEREFVSGGRAMPDALLKFVPQSNLERINSPSRQRWDELKK